MKKTSLFCALIGLTHLSSAAESTLSPVTVTSNGIQHTEFNAPFASEIHDAHDIAKSGALTIYDYLGKHSSLTVLPSYGDPLSQLLDMRGFGIENGHQNIVITVNGRRLNNVDSAPQLLSTIPLSSIERIEILKGSGAVVYGDGAMAGAINIITKDISGGEVSLAAGSHGQSTASLSAGVSQTYFALQVLAENSRGDGLRDADINGNTDETDANNFAAHLKVFPFSGAELRLGKERSWIDNLYATPLTQSEFNHNPKQRGDYRDWSGELAPYNGQQLETDVNVLGARYQFSENFSVDLNHSVEKKEAEFISQAFSWGSRYDYRSSDVSGQWQGNNLQITAGVQLFDGERQGADNTTDKDNQSFFVQLGYQLHNTLWNIGARHEKVTYHYQSDAGARLKEDESLNAWELGVNHQYSRSFSVFANLTAGYQAPDIDRFFDLFSGPTPTFNHFIKSAEHRTFNLGFNHLSATNKLKANVFYAKLKNEIFYNPLSYTNTNIDRSYKYGLELQNRWQPNNQLSVNANYSYTLAKIDRDAGSQGLFNGNKTPGVSPHTASLSVEYQISANNTLTLSETFRSRAYAVNDFANNFQQKQRVYNTTDIGVQHRVNNLTLYAQVNNLFDQRNGLWVADDAIYPVNFTRVWYAGIRASF